MSIPMWLAKIFVGALATIFIGGVVWLDGVDAKLTRLSGVPASVADHDKRLREMSKEVGRHETLDLKIENLSSLLGQTRGDLKEFGSEIKDLRRDLNAAHREP